VLLSQSRKNHIVRLEPEPYRGVASALAPDPTAPATIVTFNCTLYSIYTILSTVSINNKKNVSYYFCSSLKTWMLCIMVGVGAGGGVDA
jgi:hypothetical protein